jgi:hypothetical protein
VTWQKEQAHFSHHRRVKRLSLSALLIKAPAIMPPGQGLFFPLSRRDQKVIQKWFAQVSTALSHGAIALLLTLLAASSVHPQYVLLPL